MYKSGQVGYLSILLRSKNFSDIFSKIDSMRRIISFDKKVIADLKDKEEELNIIKQSLHNKKEQLVTLQQDNENSLVKMKGDSAKQTVLIKELRTQESLIASRVRESQTQVNETLRQIAAIRDAAPRYNPSRGAAPISENSIIAFASNFLGTPYVWGGTTPKPGFDCSGFTRYVFAHFGVSLGRTTYDQIKNGVQVSRDQLQPGDLVFFGSWSNPHHMGIYAGNNTYIHAPRTGDVVKISAMTRTDYLTARRVR